MERNLVLGPGVLAAGVKRFGTLTLLGVAATLSSLTGQASKAAEVDMQPPEIGSPAQGSSCLGDIEVLVNPKPGAAATEFVLEWEGQTSPSGPAAPIGILGSVPAGKAVIVRASKFTAFPYWRLRARAAEPSIARWSAWTSLSRVGQPPACTPKKPLDAVYILPPPPPKPLRMKAGSAHNKVPIKVENRGSAIWTTAANFFLAYHWFRDDALVVWDGTRTGLPSSVALCQSVSLNADVNAPSEPGTYILAWDMVVENVTWFSTRRVPTGNMTVTVKR